MSVTPNLHELECPICNRKKKASEFLPQELIRPAIVQGIRDSHPDWSAEKLICLDCLHHYRTEYVQRVLVTEKGELSSLDKEVVASLKEQEVVAEDLNKLFESQKTFGGTVADHVATFGGSWRFIILFMIVLVGWIILNSAQLLARPFDPFPFILLNLVLSCIAALQAPVIMMSQNRQEAKDRLRAENDYRTNLKAELEIRHINLKIDQLLTHQWRRLLEIQQLQLESMEEIYAQQPGKLRRRDTTDQRPPATGGNA